MYNQTRRKRMMLLVGFVVLVALGIIVLIHTHNGSSDNASTTHDTATTSGGDGTSSEVVTISNLEQLGDDIDSNDTYAIGADLYRYIQQSGGHTESSFKGTIRLGSLTTKYTPYQNTSTTVQIPTYSFMVDIPSVKQSYRVILVGGTNYPQDEVSVICPTASELIYPAFACENSQ